MRDKGGGRRAEGGRWPPSPPAASGGNPERAEEHDQDPRPDQNLRRPARREQPHAGARRGRPVRLHRPQRFGQDDDHADPGHALAADLGRGRRLRLLDLHASQGDPPPHRLHARLLRRLRRHEGDRVPGVFRRRLSHQGPGAAEDLQRDAGPGRPGLQARRLRHQPLPRHDAAAGPGPRAAARSQGAAAGRAGQRPGPARADRDPRPARRSSASWARRSWSPATSCPSWPTSATRSA